MSSSLRLLLEDFLGLMKEEGELDVFLPLLMSAMKHEIVYRPQKGARQYGVDISSVGKDKNGKTTLFLWLVKCGNIGRTDWSSGPQAIRQSIEDIEDVYLRSHLAPQHKKLNKKLLIVTNGDFSATLNETIPAYLEAWSDRTGVDAEQVNGSKLAAWTEEYLLDEYILPSANRTLLRRMLANVTSPELCINVGRNLIDEIISISISPADSPGKQRKQLLTALRGVRTALRVLQSWASNEENLVAPYVLCQYAVLATWSQIHLRIIDGDKEIVSEHVQLLMQLASVGGIYHQRMEPYYVVQDAYANSLPDHLLVSRTVFDELGRLGQQGCFWVYQAAESGRTELEIPVQQYVHWVKSLVSSHSCSGLPSYDYHSTNIHFCLLLLVVTGELEFAKKWIHELCQRLHYATKVRKYMPMTATFEQAIHVHWGYEEMSDDFSPTSTLLPILLTWTAVLGIDDGYSFLREQVLSNFGSVTPNFWSSEEDFDKIVSDGREIHMHGIGEAFTDIPSSPAEFLTIMSKSLSEECQINSSSWYNGRAAYIPFLAALHWNTQLPRELLVQQAVAFARK